MSNLNKGLSICLVVAILGALGSLGYLVTAPKPSQKFTEFYILNTDGKAKDYPHQVISGNPIDIIIGTVNHEDKPTSYRGEITVDNIKNKEISIGELADEERWQELVSFAPDKTGGSRKVELWFYEKGAVEPYFEDPLSLLIDVVEP